MTEPIGGYVLVKMTDESGSDPALPCASTPTRAIAGTWEAEIIDELKSAVAAPPGYVLRDRGAGSFYETGLELLLRKLGTRSLFIAGTKGNAGVEASIREACLRDYDVIAVTDCIFDVEEECE